MAPDPRNQEESGTGGSVIAGHKISLNVHYDGSEVLASKVGGNVTPLEEKVVSTGAYGMSAHEGDHQSPSVPAVVYETSLTEVAKNFDHSSISEKVTHVDSVTRNGKVESEHECLETSLPSSSSLSEVRPDTPETNSAHSGHLEEKVADLVKKSGKCEAEMLKPNLKTAELTNGPDQIIHSDALKSWQRDGAIKLRLGSQGTASVPPVSIPTLFKRTAETFPNANALAVKRDGLWQCTTYKEYYNQVLTAAKAFIKLGLQKYHGVCILGFNSPEWFIADLGAIFAGGFAAGIYTTNSPEACEHCASNCEAQLWVVEDQKQLDKVLKIKSNLPHFKHIIQYKGKPTTEGVLSWDEFLEVGRKETDVELQARLKGIAINQCCTLIYTSGTTGAPKGVMLCHDNITWTAYSGAVSTNLVEGKEVFVSYLPLSHIAAQMADIYLPMLCGGSVYFAQPDALKGSLGQTLKEVRPTRFLGVPRVWEKIHEKMLEVGRKTTGIKKTIATWAKSVGSDISERKQHQDFTKPLSYSIANALVFKKVKVVLGLDRAESLISAAAPITLDVVKFFQSLDICLTEIYGMSESSGPHTIGLEKAFKIGSAGKTLPGCQIKLDKPDDEGNGEVCMGGRNVCMGYLQMENMTNETIDNEGWLHSGDIGRIDCDGFLYITGRLKELIITAGGENIPPVLIEEQLKKELPCISNAMLIGDKRKFLSILLTLKTNMDMDSGEPLETLTCVEWCRSVGSSAKTIRDVLAGPDASIMRAIQDGIDRANKCATSNAQKIQKWTILPRDFSIPGGELGPTLKLKRPVVLKKYAETIERFYQ